MATRFDAALVCGSDRLCVSLRLSIEGAIHGMIEMLSTHQDKDSRWGVLCVDAANAFNSLNHAAMFLHAHVLWL